MTATGLSDDLPWQRAVWHALTQALVEDRLGQSLLITGAPGVGKRRLAHRLVAARLCRRPAPDADACGTCAACRQIAAGTHPDLARLSPVGSSRMIKVEQVRGFGHALRLTPQYDTGRIGWIDPADALSTSAANSLLKLLEEPPAGCVIVLVADRIATLLPTIRSRCQQWRVPAPSPDAARQWLAERGVDVADSLDPDRLRGPLALLVDRDTDAAVDREQWDADLMRLLARRANPVAMAERSRDVDRAQWIDWLCRRCERLLQASLDPGTEVPHAAFAEAARRLGPRRLAAWSRTVTRVMRQADSNADWRLMIESVWIDLAQHVAETSQS